MDVALFVYQYSSDVLEVQANLVTALVIEAVCTHKDDDSCQTSSYEMLRHGPGDVINIERVCTCISGKVYVAVRKRVGHVERSCPSQSQGVIVAPYRREDLSTDKRRKTLQMCSHG